MNPITYTAIIPHAPIIIPEVGGERQEKVAATYNSCRSLADGILKSEPEIIILISPHTPPLKKNHPVIRTSPEIKIDFSRFGCSQTFPVLKNAAADNNLWPDLSSAFEDYIQLDEFRLDHGAGVPAYFFSEKKSNIPWLIVGPDYWSRENNLKHMSKLRTVLQNNNIKAAVIASADMSHAHHKDAPAGFHPDGPVFDSQFTKIIKEKNYKELLNINKPLIENARQDSLETTLMALELSDYSKNNAEFFSYENTFGVGYLCAGLNHA